MVTDKITLEPCNSNIFKNGKEICSVIGNPNDIEYWVKSIAKKSNARVDWHCTGGIGRILHLGDDKNRQRTINILNESKNELKGIIIWVFDQNQ